MCKGYNTSRFVVMDVLSVEGTANSKLNWRRAFVSFSHREEAGRMMKCSEPLLLQDRTLDCSFRVFMKIWRYPPQKQRWSVVF